MEHAWADLTVTVEAGCTIAELQRTLAQHGQRLAMDPLWPERATIGGILATNDSGALRLGYGSLRDLIIGITLALADGTVASSGGKVVKNVAGYDLPKLATGSLGTLGVITQRRVPPASAAAEYPDVDRPVQDAARGAGVVSACSKRIDGARCLAGTICTEETNRYLVGGHGGWNRLAGGRDSRDGGTRRCARRQSCGTPARSCGRRSATWPPPYVGSSRRCRRGSQRLRRHHPHALIYTGDRHRLRSL